MSVTNQGTYLTTHAIDGCSTFSGDADIHVLAGRSVADGDRAFDRVRAACAKRRSVELLDANGTQVANVTCNEPLPVCAPWLTF